MKKEIWKWGFLGLLLTPALVACNDDDNDDYDFRKDPNITQAVESRYAGAQIVEVERTAEGYEIQIWVNNQEADMHVGSDYQWLYTEFEDIPWASLPEAVTTAFTTDGYTFNPNEDDVDGVEYPDGNRSAQYYRIELDREPTDLILAYNPDGSTYQGSIGLGRPGGGTDTGGIEASIRQAITDAVNASYPGATIREIEREPNGFEAQLFLNGAEADMHFDSNCQWTYTEFEDMPWVSLPEAVTMAFTAGGYTFNANEDDVDRIEYPDGDGIAQYYRIELDREPTDLVLEYNPDGSLRP